MAEESYFIDTIQREIEGDGNTTPLISTELDSVRAYQWELTFRNLLVNDTGGPLQQPLTLGAKQVNGVGFSVEDIEVNRVNDKVYYPGRPSMDELVVTFDSLQKAKLDKRLYEVMAMSYDPRTGKVNTIAGVDLNTYQTKFEIGGMQLEGNGTPRNMIRLFGCYPKKITHGEYNYSTNEFHTIEMTFRYDNFVTTYDANGQVNFNTN